MVIETLNRDALNNAYMRFRRLLLYKIWNHKSDIDEACLKKYYDEIIDECIKSLIWYHDGYCERNGIIYDKNQLVAELHIYFQNKIKEILIEENIKLDKNEKINYSICDSYQVKYNKRQKNKPKTLLEGWIVFIICIIIESLFYDAIACWIITIIIFLVWRNNEINKYN